MDEAFWNSLMIQILRGLRASVVNLFPYITPQDRG
jgi:hypothetical protein